VAAFNAANRYKKRGIAAVATMFGISFTATQLNQGGALLHVQKDGTVLLSHGGTEMGQGLHTKMARVAATTLDIPIEAVYIAETATDKVANTTATAASSGSDINGGAVLLAATELKERLAPFLAKHRPAGLLTDEQRLEAFGKAASDAFFNRVNLTAQAYHRTPIKGVDWKKQKVNEFAGEPFWYYTHGVAASEVEIDCLTGDMSILRTDIVHDVGKTLNAALDIGQIEGAFMQGMGLMSIEEIAYNKEGKLLSKGPGMYKIPGFGDIPHDFRVHLLENSEGPAVMGSKAVGEPPLYLATSVFFALKEAILESRKDFAAEQKSTSHEALDRFLQLDAPLSCENIRMACLDMLNPTGEKTQWHARV
jgi:xanthine dehydrogenase/oxidase